MDEKGFRDFAQRSQRCERLDEETIRSHLATVAEFESFLRKKDAKRDFRNATSRDLQNFSVQLMTNGENTLENFLALLRYSRFTDNREVEVALLELVDGSDVFDNLSETLRHTVDEGVFSEILRGINLPPLGTHPKEKPKTTKVIMERLEAKLGERKCREVLLSGPHATPKEEFVSERQKFLASNGIDDFLEKRHEEYVDLLEKHAKKNTLYYTQEIDEEVLEYVRRTPTCQNGVRNGSLIYVTKIPYMAKKYLHERDERKKRYYYCHCPWVRESILSNVRVSPNFCYCSAGFEKRPWDVIFNQPVKADVIETVLKGDLLCKFAIHVPKEFLKS